MNFIGNLVFCRGSIIDIGTGGGKAGGEVVSKGTPDDIAKD